MLTPMGTKKMMLTEAGKQLVGSVVVTRVFPRSYNGIRNGYTNQMKIVSIMGKMERKIKNHK